MPKFKSRAGVEIEAFQVTEDVLQVPTEEGIERCKRGDGIATIDGRTFRVRAPLFAALFGGEEKTGGGKSEEKTGGGKSEKP